jgi:hypothetical protein
LSLPWIASRQKALPSGKISKMSYWRSMGLWEILGGGRYYALPEVLGNTALPVVSKRESRRRATQSQFRAGSVAE